MAEEKKIVTGGFRATLALIIAIIAIIISIIAYDHSSENNTMRKQVDNLKATVQEMKNETSQKLDDVRRQTADALENLSKKLKEEKKQQ